MKKNLSTVMLLGFLFAFQAMNAQMNLLQGSGMEAADQASWSAIAYGDAPETVTWGYTGVIPAEGSGGALRLKTADPSPDVQYVIYQAVTLAEGEPYIFDVAVKSIGKRNTWFQIYVGATDPATLTGDYDDNQIASYFSWDGNNTTDGTFSTTAQEKPVTFTPKTSGTYYVVMKFGCNGNGQFEILVDNPSLMKQVMPTANFSARPRAGFTPLTVNFANTSVRAIDYEWDFGDGNVSAEANPNHVYNSPGNYKVSLKAIGEYGSHTLEKDDNFIQAKAFPGQLTGGGKLQGGNMEDATQWKISFLNSPAEQKPVATWNYTADKPKAGQGGGLRIKGSGANSVTVQYCIYQQVTLDASKVYRVNGAFKDLSPDLFHFWSEIYLTTTEPQDGSDISSSTPDTKMLTSLGNWDDAEGLTKGLDGTYQAFATVDEFIPAESGNYFFVFKTGVWVDNGQSADFDILIDELVLEEVRTKPYTNFTADNNQGFAPLNVSFINTTSFATSYVWNFGDGETSTEANPTHTYTAVGQYNVSLKATNEMGDSTIVKNDFVIVNERPDLPGGEKLYGGDMENGGFWYTATTGAAAPVTLTWNYTENIPTGGEGGALRMQSSPGNGRGSNIVLYQPVTVKKGYMYDFDCLYKAIGNTSNLWMQTYMTTEKPNDSNDPEQEENTLGQLNTWADSSVGTYDGPFSGKAIKGNAYTGELLSYHHTGEDGALMYFMIKMGTWEGGADIVLDNLSLKESLWAPKPKADFIVSNPPSASSKAPYTVEFLDNSQNATKWEWDFGDGSPIEVITDSEYGDIEHTYTKEGWYSVTLTVYGGSLSDSFTIINAVKLGPEPSGIPNVTDAGQIVRVIDRKINIVSEGNLDDVSIFNIGGQIVQSVRMQTNRFVSDELPQGIYIVKAGMQVHKIVIR